jgi:hypothetical protein
MENLKTVPVTHSFVLNIEVSNETSKFQNDPDLLDFLRKMNIENAFKLMPGKPIKLNIPIVLKQPEDKRKLKSRSKIENKSEKTKGKTPTKGSLLDQHEDEEDYVRKRSTKDSKEPFYFNNKPEFIKQIREMLSSIKQTDEDASCDKESKTFSPLAHQLIVQRYLSITTPYRGLLFYHGLGSGKTCSSISIIEGMVQDKNVFVMTPASLQANYRTQMRFCGNQIFRNNNHWVFKKLTSEKDFKPILQEMNVDMSYFSLKIKALALKNKGIWVTIPNEDNNYDDLDIREKETLDEQIELMIKEKYTFINFNGIRNESWNVLTQQGKTNPFNNSVVVIDEAHNFVSRIVNKLQKGKVKGTDDDKSQKKTVSIKMYDAIMEAQNCRVVLLTGTPFINYPSELGTLFNLIHGYNVVLSFKLAYKAGAKPLNTKAFKDLFQDETIESLEYSAPYLKFTKTPFGFIKVGGQMMYNSKGNLYYDDFKRILVQKLGTIDGLQIIEATFQKFKLLPDIGEEFDKYFLEGDNIKNKEFFQKKILGMVSYVGDNKKLMPDIVKSTERDKQGRLIQSDIHVEYVQMSKHQIDEYSKIRDQEREQERGRKKRADDVETNSTYRVFSRAACNFAFPFDPPQDRRPMPGSKEVSEDALDAITDEEKMNDVDGKYTSEDVEKDTSDKRYIKAIQDILQRFDQRAPYYFESDIPKLTKDVFDAPHNLMKYSPKFHRILKNLMNEDNVGCHLLYTNFRKLEGIGLLRIILMYYGYCELKVVKIGDTYTLKIMSKYNIKNLKEMRCFALYTGTEGPEEKEIIRNIYNNNYNALPNSIQEQLRSQFPDPEHEGEIMSNMHGDVIQLLMITASGAEGIDLKNTRFVHITEPYWHHVRINQVIGRARRICSHMQLEKELQDVTVFMYISYFGDIDLEGYPNIKNLDNGESTDMKLYETMKRKEKVSSIFLNTLKETAIDCKHNCFTTKSKSEFLTHPDYSEEKLTAFKKATKKTEYAKKTIDGKQYVTLEIKNPDGTRDGDIRVYEWKEYDALREGAPVAPVGILVDGKLQTV